MSFAVGLCIILGLISSGLTFLLFGKRKWTSLAAGCAVIAGSLLWFLSPVCVAIGGADLANFDPPISSRTDTGLIGQRIFQRRDGGWHQCKTRISRQFFF
jgi:hypothetical protein